MGAAAEVNPARVGDGERRDVVDVPLHQPLEAVLDAENFHAAEARADGGGAEDAVDAGGGAAGAQDAELLLLGHRGGGYCHDPRSSGGKTSLRTEV